LQVAPDQRWVSFLAGGRLFAVRPDGGSPHPLLPDGDPPLMVADYAWLPPGDGASAGRVLVLTDRGLRQLNLTPTLGRPTPPGLPAGLPDAGVQGLAVAPDGTVACLLNTPGAPTLTLTGGTTLSLPAMPTGAEIHWCPGGGCLFYQDGSPTAARLHLIDLAGHTLMDGPLDSAR
jgi:hypothetical protein